MPRLPLIAAIALSAAVPVSACAQGTAPGSDFASIDDIEWTYRAAGEHDGDPLLRVSRDGMNSTSGLDELPEVMAALGGSAAVPGQGVSFSLVREAGALACVGKTTEPGRAAGTCRFDPDERFVRELAVRDLPPEDVEQLLVLALVDARMASVDGFSRNGLRIADADEFVAVSALELTPEYAEELRGAGIEVTRVKDLIPAWSLGVDARWLREMAEAGYPNLGLKKAIQLRALDVTPDYARGMAKVMRAVDGTE